MNKKKYTVTIIGLGNIGLLYDIERDDDSNEFLSHTRSTFFHDNFEIKFLIDNDVKKLELAKSKYGNKINYLSEINSSFFATDIIVLASLPEVNFEYLNILKSQIKVKLFIIEKPFLNENTDITFFNNILQKTYVNYYRKSLPFFKELRNKISKFSYGNLLGANIYYSKGLKNNGSHLIDLINFLLGPNFDLDSIQIINYINDYRKDDLSVTFSINYQYNSKTSSVIFQALDERMFSLIELDLVFEKQRFRIFDFGGKIEVYRVEKDEVFSAYKKLVPYKVVDSDINSYGLHTYDTIYNILEGEEQNYSSLKDESNTQKLKEAIISKLDYFKKNE